MLFLIILLSFYLPVLSYTNEVSISSQKNRMVLLIFGFSLPLPSCDSAELL